MAQEIIVIIPARGGSKGIPRKNLRIFHGAPLITHAIETAKSVSKVTQVVVTSDDAEILEIAELHGVVAFKRDPKLASDDATLEPVIAEVVNALDLSNAIVVTMQTTCPLIRASTVDHIIQEIELHPEATSFTVTENRHLSWLKDDDGFLPNYEKRVNRQKMPPVFYETGGVVACFGDKLSTYGTRFLPPYRPISVSETESIDIDTAFDWAMADAVVAQKRIAIFVKANETIGLGHLYRQLTLYDYLAKHDVCFFCRADETLIQKILVDKFIKFETFDASSLGDQLVDFKPDIIINDILDDWVNLIDQQSSSSAKILVFETEALALGARYEVINALYPPKHSEDRVGPDWFLLRPEFMLSKPKIVSDLVKEILVTFGGVDPADQSFRMYNILLDELYNGTRRTIVLGKGYNGKLLNMQSGDGIEILRDTNRISRYMERADLAITSKGRTVYELAKCGIPTISIAQNDREMRHVYGAVRFIDLGLHSEVSDANIASAIRNMISDSNMRKNLCENNRLIPFDGNRNILTLIEDL